MEIFHTLMWCAKVVLFQELYSLVFRSGKVMIKVLKLVFMVIWISGCGGSNSTDALETNSTAADNIVVGDENADDNNTGDSSETAAITLDDSESDNTIIIDDITNDSTADTNNEVVDALVSDSETDAVAADESNNVIVTDEANNETDAETLTDSNAISLLPNGVSFKANSLQRRGMKGDNFDQTWAADNSVIMALDDGDWFNERFRYHSHLYKLEGGSNGFSVQDIENYPDFAVSGDGWFAYGTLSVNGVLYSLVSKTQGNNWSEGPFRGMKMLRSNDSGSTWHRVDRNNNERFLDQSDIARELLNTEEMFFFEEFGRTGKGREAYPFSYATFVQSGRDHSASPDGYVYIYSPEGANSHQLLLARVPADLLGLRSAWEYFSGWNGDSPTWSSNIEQRQPNLVYPERASTGEFFGWYSWLPSVVWNEGLGVYVMASGGTYGGGGATDSANDYYHRFMHNKSGTLGFWYSANPYGPWTRFYYNEDWTVDDSKNLTYQPKLSPKWISEDGRTMTLIWSDAMRDSEGNSHTVNYMWNQMEIEISTGQ